MTDLRPALKLRAATEHDAEILLEWRNDPTTREMSQTSTPVTRATHMAWLHNALSNDKCLIFIAEDNGDPVGMVRLDVDRDGKAAEVSINIAPHARNKKLAASLLHIAQAHMATSAPGIKMLTARIKTGNTQSERAFERAGYTQVREEHGYNFYEVAL